MGFGTGDDVREIRDDLAAQRKLTTRMRAALRTLRNASEHYHGDAVLDEAKKEADAALVILS